MNIFENITKQKIEGWPFMNMVYVNNFLLYQKTFTPEVGAGEVLVSWKYRWRGGMYANACLV